MDGFIYIAWLREFMASGSNTYKLGATRNPAQRILSYPKGSVFVFTEMCQDPFERESELLQLFRTKFHQRLDLGREYFDGDCQEMKATVFNHLSLQNTSRISPNLSRTPVDSEVAILRFVDTHRTTLCSSSTPSDLLHARFMDFADKSGWLVTTKHGPFTKAIVRLCGATTSVGRIQGELTRIVTFPPAHSSALTPTHDHEDEDNVVKRFIDSHITPGVGFTLKMAKTVWMRHPDMYRIKRISTLKTKLETLLRTPCHEQKRMDNMKNVNVFLGFQLHDTPIVHIN